MAQLKNLLEIPVELEIYDMMALGYAAAESKPRPVRERVEMVHDDTYDRARFRTDQQVKGYILSLWKR